MRKTTISIEIRPRRARDGESKTGQPGPLQQLDSHYGLVGMGGSLSQWLTGSRGCHLVSKRGSFRKGVLSNHDPGSGPTQPKETMMRFYNQPHRFYAGIDLHARTMHVCIL